MASTPLIITPSAATRGRPSAVREEAFDALRVVAAIGVAFFLIGAFDLALVWVPLAFGSPEWEFGTVISTMNGLPVPVMGIGLLLAAAIAGDSRRTARAVAVALVVLALVVAMMGILWATTLPFAFKPVTNDVIRVGLYKAVAKTAMQVLAYTTLFVVLAVFAWRRSAR